MVIIIMIRTLVTERMIASITEVIKITIIVIKWLKIQTTKNWSGKNAWKYLLLKVTNTTAKKKKKKTTQRPK